MYPCLLLMTMIFFHIIADFNIQGILAQMKQKSFYDQYRYRVNLYRYDHIVALLMHSFSWTFMIHIPGIMYLILMGKWSMFENEWTVYLIFFTVHMIIHALTDHAKANWYLINLVMDQTIHILQIIIIWITFIN